MNNREKNLALKREVLTHYGEGKCQCVKCLENRLACLSLDHINSDGNKLRQQGKDIRGSGLYRQLRTQGYPNGYQTLCMNCQFVKRYVNGEWGNDGAPNAQACSRGGQTTRDRYGSEHFRKMAIISNGLRWGKQKPTNVSEQSNALS
jgi:hypothetical protein